MFLTLDDIRRWKDELFLIDGQLQELSRKKEAINKRLEAAALFVPPDEIARIFGETSTETEEAEPTDPSSLSWTKNILRILTEENRGMTRDEIKNRLSETALAEKLSVNDKGFYSAIGKLDDRKVIIKHRYRLYTQESYRAFREAVDAGIVDDEFDQSLTNTTSRRSPFSKAMLDFVLKHPNGTEAGQIKHHLRQIPEFTATIDNNSTHVYNVMSKLVKRGNILKVGKTYYPLSNGTDDGGRSSRQAALPSVNNGGGL